MRPATPRLSETPTGLAWLSQFAAADVEIAASLLDHMLLLNAEQVSDVLRIQLRKLGRERSSKKRRLALYAERKLNAPFFTEKRLPDRQGVSRLRAAGNTFAPIAPIRGGTRVGSEGLIANVISQIVKAPPGTQVYVNHPGPDRIRGKTRPTQTIVIVTDLIGSGNRIVTWLDALWKIRSVRSWVSLNLVDFAVVSAVSTAAGEALVRRHRLKPTVHSQFRAPSLSSKSTDPNDHKRLALIQQYGPSAGRGAARTGYGPEPCLVAFSYRLPNNTPALIHQSDPAVPWRALYDGGLPEDLGRTFNVRGEQEVIDLAAEATGIELAKGLTLKHQRSALVLSLISGRLRPGQIEAIAEQTQLPLPDVALVVSSAETDGLLDAKGRLTDAGQTFVLASRLGDKKRPTVSTNPEPYYPKSLRIPSGLV
ncbi:hypothetical protein HMPREF0185_03179 [Brevundimonas diminuta 470-4]|nr:hypothetical protein HMPREF0185_03179 [Brevundimonas diminuta 470-4]